ncbi:MAG: hypothetical protein EOO39_28250, partial [Cytophagaceae bacterium]
MELPASYQPPSLSGVALVSTQYSYDLDRQLTQITRPTGATANFSYGSTTGLLSSITLAGGSNTYTYEANNDRIAKIDSVDGVRTNYSYYGYELQAVAQRKTATDYLLGKVVRYFDTSHRPYYELIQGNASATYYGTTTTYNNDDQPSQIGYLNLTYSYPSGRISNTSMDTVSDTRTFDAFGNSSGYSAVYTPSGGTASQLYSYTITRDTLHRIATKSETVQGITNVYAYTYDSVGRLSTVFKNGLAYSSYSYDSNSNRTSGATGGVPFTATYDAQDRLLTYNAKTYTYNANGDRTQVIYPDATTQDYTWDAIGNVKSVKLQDGRLTVHHLDGENRHVALFVDGVLNRRLLYSSTDRIVARVNDTGVLSEVYVHGPRQSVPEYMFKNGYRYRIIVDHLGSVRLVVRTLDGVIAQRIDYNDLGDIIADTSPGFQPYGFAGGIYLAYGRLIKFGARIYDPSTGRWLSKDPILFVGGDTNLYGYVANDTVNFIDPSGLEGRCSDDSNCSPLGVTNAPGGGGGGGSRLIEPGAKVYVSPNG